MQLYNNDNNNNRNNLAKEDSTQKRTVNKKKKTTKASSGLLSGDNLRLLKRSAIIGMVLMCLISSYMSRNQVLMLLSLAFGAVTLYTMDMAE